MTYLPEVSPRDLFINQLTEEEQLDGLRASCHALGLNGDVQIHGEEMKHFTRMTKKLDSPTKQNVVLMGRKTWESIPSKFRPLPGRLNVVLSSQMKEQQDSCGKVIVCQDFDDALKKVSTKSPEVETVWVIGGHSVYKMALESEYLHRIYLTKIMKDFECDVFFPSFNVTEFKLVEDPCVPSEVQEEGGIQYKYEVYEKI